MIEQILVPLGVGSGWLLERIHLQHYADYSGKSKREGTFAYRLSNELSKIYQHDGVLTWLKEELTTFPLFKAVYYRLKR